MPEPYTPDPVAVLRADVDELKAAVTAIKAQIGEQPPAPAAFAAAFIEKWKHRGGTPAEKGIFRAKYRVEVGEAIPPMPAFDEREVTERATYGYASYGGKPYGGVNQAAADAAISVIANATGETAGNLKETGYGLTDADVCAYLYRMGICGGSGGLEPWHYRGQTFAHVLGPNFGGGGPSGD